MMADLEVRLGGAIPEGVTPGVARIEYESRVDGRRDWALVVEPSNRSDWIVFLHGHGGGPERLWTRQDLRQTWLPGLIGHGFGVLAPDLRGNSWMCPSAAEDLHDLIGFVRERHLVRHFIFASASMGGTANLIYAVLHPEDVSGVAALCPATDIAAYHRWCRARNMGIVAEIADAVEAAYGGPPDARPDIYAAHSALENADCMAVPLFIVHGTGDAVIPVAESRRLVGRMAGRERLVYIEVPGGHHDSPLPMMDQAIDWLDEEVCGRSA